MLTDYAAKKKKGSGFSQTNRFRPDDKLPDIVTVVNMPAVEQSKPKTPFTHASSVTNKQAWYEKHEVSCGQREDMRGERCEATQEKRRQEQKTRGKHLNSIHITTNYHNLLI